MTWVGPILSHKRTQSKRIYKERSKIGVMWRRGKEVTSQRNRCDQQKVKKSRKQNPLQSLQKKAALSQHLDFSLIKSISDFSDLQNY
jgi:hypothetical protein